MRWYLHGQSVSSLLLLALCLLAWGRELSVQISNAGHGWDREHCVQVSKAGHVRDVPTPYPKIFPENSVIPTLWQTASCISPHKSCHAKRTSMQNTSFCFYGCWSAPGARNLEPHSKQTTAHAATRTHSPQFRRGNCCPLLAHHVRLKEAISQLWRALGDGLEPRFSVALAAEIGCGGKLLSTHFGSC